MGRGPSIEGRKNAADAQKARTFTKLIREITMAARSGGVDPAGNPRLRLAIDRALDANMTKDTIERTLKRVSGASGGEAMVEIRYEGYGPGGVAIMVDCMSDNPTRTVADVRHAFTKHGGHLGTSGSVAFQFKEAGELWFKTVGNAKLEERIFEVASEAGADDVQSEDGYTEVVTAPHAFQAVKKALIDAGFTPLQADLVMRPQNRIAVASETAEALKKLLQALEELEDVQKVVHNAELPESS
jgi:YebC/PmpR family DNA-binding regulatory protein